MFCAIALGALWCPLEVVHFLVCATRVLQWGSKKLQKHFKTHSLGRFGGIFFLETSLDKTCVPMQRGARFSFLQSVPMQRVAHFFDEIAFPCRWRSIFTRSAPSGGSGLVCLDWSVWTGLSGPVCLDPVCLDPVCLDPVCLDPVCLDPVCLDLSNLLSRALLPTTRLEAPPSLLSASAGCYVKAL